VLPVIPATIVSGRRRAHTLSAVTYELSLQVNSPLRRRLALSVLAMPWLLSACAGRSESAAARTLVELQIASDGDLLKFKPTELTCPAGAQVRLTFAHTGKFISFEHNWVLILPHTFDAVNKAALAAGEKNGWVPPNDKRILAATPLCSRGHKVVVEFIAPRAGDYPFICSNPGHAEDMWGVLHVTAA
jgi:azurin